MLNKDTLEIAQTGNDVKNEIPGIQEGSDTTIERRSVKQNY